MEVDRQNRTRSAKVAAYLALLLISMLANGCSSKKGTAVLGEVLALAEANIGDNPSVTHPGLLQRAAINTIAEGSRYSVPEGKAVVISFVPGIFAVARRSAELTCDTLRLDKDGNETETDAIQERRVSLRMTSGAATFLLPWEDVSGQSTIEIALAHAQITAALGALFHVDVTDSAIRITCAELALDISTAAGETHLVANQVCTLTSASNEPVIAAAEPDEEFQADAAIAALDKDWTSQLMRERRNAVVPWRTR